MAEEGRKGSGFDQALAVWNRRKGLSLLSFVIPFTAVVSTIFFLPNIFRSTATVLIEGQQLPEAFVRSTVTSAVETRLHTITQEILSRSRLQGLIDQFGLYRDLKKRVSLEEVIERMRGDIQMDLKGVKQVEKDRATIAFSISYRGSDSSTVSQVTNTLASFYIEENLKVRERQAAGTAEFLKTQLEEVKVRLDEQEKHVSAFKRANMGELPQQLDANLAILQRIMMQLQVNRDNMPRIMERRSELSQQLIELEALRPSGGPDAAADRLSKLRQELLDFKTRFTDQHPSVIRLKAEIEELERKFADKKGGTDPDVSEKDPVVFTSPSVLRLRQSLADVDGEIAASKAEAKRLQKDIATYQQRVENSPRREQEFHGMFRDYETTRELYQSLLKRYDEARLSESMEQRQKGEQFRILDPATASEKPVAPDRSRLLFMGLVLSLGIVGTAIFLAEQLDASFHSVDDLRAFTQVPVLISIPSLQTEADLNQRHWRARVVAIATTVVLIIIVGTAFILAGGNEQLAWMLVRSRT